MFQILGRNSCWERQGETWGYQLYYKGKKLVLCRRTEQGGYYLSNYDLYSLHSFRDGMAQRYSNLALDYLGLMQMINCRATEMKFKMEELGTF